MARQVDELVKDILRVQTDALKKIQLLEEELRAKNEEDPNLPISDPEVTVALPPLRIAAFNIQIFGQTKSSKTDVTEVLVKILQRYDLILIQEIRDSQNTALDQLVKSCSEIDPDNPFAVTVSERLGRGNCKEQYAFMYRSKSLSVAGTYQFDDGVDDGTDVFQREPFAVRFNSPFTEIQDFAIIAIHTAPKDAVKEIGALHNVHAMTRNHWDLENIIIAGDFNADEGYVDQDDWSKIALRNDRRFKWLIDDTTDTTVGNTDRAYDRFVVTGKKLLECIIPGSAKPFLFDVAFGMSSEEAEDVSDHYPIELEILGKVNRELQNNVGTSLQIVVDQVKPATKESDIRKICRADPGVESAYFKHQVIYDDSRMVSVETVRENVSDVMKSLREFQLAFPNVLYDDTLCMVKAYLDALSTTPWPYVYGLIKKVNYDRFDITVKASLMSPLLCSVTVTKRIS